MPRMPFNSSSLFDLPDFDRGLPIPPPPVHLAQPPYVVRGYLHHFQRAYTVASGFSTAEAARALLDVHVRYAEEAGWHIHRTDPDSVLCVCPYDFENSYSLFVERQATPLFGRN